MMRTMTYGRILAACAAAVFAGAAVVGIAGCGQGDLAATGDPTGGTPLRAVANPGNAALYKADGSFDPAAAKEAYFAMMAAFDYPVPAVLKGEQFWVCDFVQRDFEKQEGIRESKAIEAHSRLK